VPAKLITLIKSRDAEGAASLFRWLPATARGLIRTLGIDHCIVNVADRRSPWGDSKDGTPPLYDAILEVPLKGEPAIPAELLSAQLARDAEAHVYLADQSVLKSPAIDSTSSINLMTVWDAKRDQNAAETRRHWREHVPLALSIHHGATRYVQCWLEKPLTRGAPAHAGVATLRFPSMEVMATGLFRSAEDVAIIDQDVAEFIETWHVLYTTETVLVGKHP
jgi:hypothetical protein